MSVVADAPTGEGAPAGGPPESDANMEARAEPQP